MNFRFRDANGEEIRITDLASLRWLVQGGRIKADSLLFDEERSAWRVAGECPEYGAALSGMGAQPGGFDEVPPYGGSSYDASSYAPPGSSPQPSASVLYGTAYEQPPQEKPWPVVVGGLVILASVIMILFAVSKYSSSAYWAGYRLGQVTGVSLLIALGAFLVWRFALNKKKGMGLLIFAGGFLLTCSYFTITAVRESQSSEIALEEIAALARQAMNGELIQSKDFDDKKYGQIGPLLKIINEYVMQIQSDFLSLNKDMEEQKFATMLTEETLKNAATIAGGQARLRAAREAIDRHQTIFKQRTDEVPIKVAAVNVPETIKREFLAGFNSSKDQSIQTIFEFHEIERAIFAKAEEILNFLKARQGEYRFTGGQIKFDSQRDANEYNRYIEEINRLVKRETDWREKTVRKSRDQLEQLQRKTNRR